MSVAKLDAWRTLARDIREVPEAALARPDSTVSVELRMACQLQGYPWGDLFIQVLQIQASHSRDLNDDVAYRAALLLGNLRAILLADATRCEPVISTSAFLPRRVHRCTWPACGCADDAICAAEVKRREEALRLARAM